MDIKKIMVIGAGIMGHGIAMVFARSGFHVSLVDVNEKIIQKAMDNIKKFLEGSVKREKMTPQEADSVLSLLRVSTYMDVEARDADFLIEAIVENKDAKAGLFSKLNNLCKAETIFATNTSQLSVSELGLASQRPEKFIGMHWFNPPALMRLIEIPAGVRTSQETVNTVVDLAKKVGKQPFVCKDSPGFVVNRILNPWYNEAMRLVDERVASVEDIDKALKVGGGFRMGPLELRDMIGLDTALFLTESLYQNLRNEKFNPPRCLRNLVYGGNLGRKTGKGFYDYSDKTSKS